MAGTAFLNLLVKAKGSVLASHAQVVMRNHHLHD